MSCTKTRCGSCDASRSAHDLLGDVVNGNMQYLLLRGHVCRVRLPNEQEEKHFRGGVLPGFQANKMRALVLCDDSDVASDVCAYHWAHPFPKPQTKWPDVYRDMASSEKQHKSGRTVAHLWAYSTALVSKN